MCIWGTVFGHSHRPQRSLVAGGINHAPICLTSRVVFTPFLSSVSVFTSACLPSHMNTTQWTYWWGCYPSSDLCSHLSPTLSLRPSPHLFRGPFQSSFTPLTPIPYSTSYYIAPPLRMFSNSAFWLPISRCLQRDTSVFLGSVQSSVCNKCGGKHPFFISNNIMTHIHTIAFSYMCNCNWSQ